MNHTKTIELKKITAAELAQMIQQDWVVERLKAQPIGTSLWKSNTVSRITSWEPSCNLCHEQIVSWLTDWVGQGYTVYWTRSQVKDEALLWGLTEEMPGLQVATQVALQDGGDYGMGWMDD